MKMYCPRCDVALLPRWLGKAQFHLCGACKGVAITRYALANLAGTAPVQAFWKEALDAGRKSECSCPSCLRKMTTAFQQQGARLVELDVCGQCHLVWFDHGEYDAVVASARSAASAALRAPPPSAPPPPGAATAAPGPDAGYGVGTVLLALIGLPVEEEVGPLARYPHVTRGLAAVCVLTSAWGFAHEQAVLSSFAFRAGLPFLRTLSTAIAHFFVHGDWWHLLGNMYFLWVFGDDVENELGHARFLALVACASFAGCFLFTFSPTAAQIPVIGASGGISGVISYYMIRFPYRRFRIMFLFMIFALPAFVVGGMFFFKDLLGVLLQVAGTSHVSHLSHLGGALAGAAWALYIASRDRVESGG